MINRPVRSICEVLGLPIIILTPLSDRVSFDALDHGPQRKVLKLGGFYHNRIGFITGSDASGTHSVDYQPRLYSGLQ